MRRRSKGFQARPSRRGRSNGHYSGYGSNGSYGDYIVPGSSSNYADQRDRARTPATQPSPSRSSTRTELSRSSSQPALADPRGAAGQAGAFPPATHVSRVRFRLHHWYRALSWPTRAGIIFACIFAAMTLLPAGAAGLAHHGFTFAAANPQWRQTRDARQTVTVYHSADGVTESMALNDYVLDVLAAEIDPNSPMAALQATAVAIRTYAMHAVDAQTGAAASATAPAATTNTAASASTSAIAPAAPAKPASANTAAPRANNPAGTPAPPTAAAASTHGADLTDNASADLPLMNATAQQQRFGVAYAADRARLESAVTSTDGMTLTVGGNPILAFITPLSAGQTRDGTKELPSHPAYLPSIACPADAKADNFNQAFHVTKAAVARKLKVSEKTLKLPALQPTGVDKAGYAKTVTDGSGGQWTAVSFAAAFQLPSTHMKFHVDGNVLVIQTQGVGSGYGLSLNQAATEAGAGDDFKSILSRFYPGTTIHGG